MEPVRTHPRWPASTSRRTVDDSKTEAIGRQQSSIERYVTGVFELIYDRCIYRKSENCERWDEDNKADSGKEPCAIAIQAVLE
jgi:hypothetical protein